MSQFPIDKTDDWEARQDAKRQVTPIPPIPDLHEQIKRWLWKQNFTCSRTLDVADVADLIEKYTDERIAKLTEKLNKIATLIDPTNGNSYYGTSLGYEIRRILDEG